MGPTYKNPILLKVLVPSPFYWHWAKCHSNKAIVLKKIKSNQMEWIASKLCVLHLTNLMVISSQIELKLTLIPVHGPTAISYHLDFTDGPHGWIYRMLFSFCLSAWNTWTGDGIEKLGTKHHRRWKIGNDFLWKGKKKRKSGFGLFTCFGLVLPNLSHGVIWSYQALGSVITLAFSTLAFFMSLM